MTWRHDEHCPYCHSEYEMIRDETRQGWQCEDCWAFWADEDLKNIRLGLQGERICGTCQYTFYVMPDESINKCPACRSSHIKLAHPEAFDDNLQQNGSRAALARCHSSASASTTTPF